MNPEYVPNPVPGFVFFSNFGPEQDRVGLVVYISTKYDLPIEDIYVEPFKGMWAGFIRDKHASIARALEELCKAEMALRKRMF